MIKATILLVEDDENLGFVIKDNLEEEGYNVIWVKDGEAGFENFCKEKFDLCILDVMLPKKDGFHLGQEIKSVKENMPMIFLTAKSLDPDKIQGFKIGADDYITKPFSQRLLLARIRTVLRRAAGGVMKTSGPNIICQGELLMDPDRHLCSWKGKEVKLTVTEFLILQALALRPGMVKNRDQLMDAAYGESIFLDDRTIDSHIKRLRRKLRVSDPSFDQIETLYGIGYKYKTE